MKTQDMKQEAEAMGIPYEKKGRVLVWHDEFDKETLDRTKWCFDRTMSGKDRIYDNGEEQVRVENGLLHMHTSWNDDNPEFPYTLPEGLTTTKTMNFKYGYLEMHGKVPFRFGAWPSFWMQSATPFAKADYMAEIDIFEVFSSPNKLGSTLHKWGHNTHSSLSANVSPWEYTFKDYENLNNEFHTYAFEWNEEETRFYVDGEQYACFSIREEDDFDTEKLPTMQGFHDFAYIIFNNEFFSPKGSWVVNGWSITDKKDMPIDYYIDWVRLYQNPDKEEIHLGDEIAAAEAAKKK